MAEQKESVGIAAPVTGAVHRFAVERMMEAMREMHVLKDEEYKDSWAKRGHVGIFFTVVRPWDRIENAMTRYVAHSSALSLSFFDALIDVAMYCLKWAAMIAYNNPKEWGDWCKSVGLDYSSYVLYPSNIAGTVVAEGVAKRVEELKDADVKP